MAALIQLNCEGLPYGSRPHRFHTVPTVGQTLHLKNCDVEVLAVGLVAFPPSKTSMPVDPVARVHVKILRQFVEAPTGVLLDQTEGPVQVRHVLDPATGRYREEVVGAKPAHSGVPPVFDPSAPFTLEQEQELIRKDEEDRRKTFKHLQDAGDNKL